MVTSIKLRNKGVWLFVVFISVSIFGAPRDQQFTTQGLLDYSEDTALPFRKMGPPETVIVLNSRKENTITAKRGSKFFIPQDAFVYPDGRRVTGDVEFKVKEVIDDFDFITAGIDLTYTDENGQTMYFQSAGMFHVDARASGKKLKLAPGKKIGVEFPNVVPGDEFFVYKMDEEGRWQKHGHNQETVPIELVQAMQDEYYEGRIGVRIYAIDGMTWWNFDSPYPHVACLKGKIDDPGKLLNKHYSIHTIGIDYKGSFWRHGLSGDAFKINAHRSKQAKVLISDADGHAGISSVIQVTDKKGFDKHEEGPDNFCQDAGSITIQKLDDNILDDKNAFQRFLGLPSEVYRVDYERRDKDEGSPE